MVGPAAVAALGAGGLLALAGACLLVVRRRSAGGEPSTTAADADDANDAADEDAKLPRRIETVSVSTRVKAYPYQRQCETSHDEKKSSVPDVHCDV